MHGAEAVLTKCTFFSTQCIAKRRLPKTYRVTNLDSKLRRERTKLEGRAMHRAKSTGVLCPLVLSVDLDKCELIESKLNGVKLVDFLHNNKRAATILRKTGEQLARLHAAGLSHGDSTTSNFMVDSGNVYVFDFGLSEFNPSMEEKAIDILLFRKSVSPVQFNHFITGYRGFAGKETQRLLAQVAEIGSRARYVER